jgi:hypothetical protein
MCFFIFNVVFIVEQKLQVQVFEKEVITFDEQYFKVSNKILDNYVVDSGLALAHVDGLLPDDVCLVFFYVSFF